MDTTTVRKTYKYQLKPTPDQERVMELVLRRCRELYNAGLEERKTAWEKGGSSSTLASQSAQLPAIKEVRPEYGDIHSQVLLQDVLTRLDRAYQAFFRRVAAGEHPGYPRFQGANRYASFTYKQFGNGAQLENGVLVLSKSGRSAVRWSRPVPGTIKTVTVSREADGWYACCSCAGVPTHPLPLTGQETGLDGGLGVFLATADGETVANPRPFRRAEKQRLAKAQKRVSRRKKGSKRRNQARTLLAKKHQTVRRQRQDFQHQVAL